MRRFILLLGLVWLIPACGSVPEEQQTLPTAQRVEEGIPLPEEEDDLVHQWAESAEASSAYAVENWSAEQATGEPNTSRCGDIQTAWASASSDAVEWLELKYELPVHVTGVNIIQTFNPNQVSKVELVGPFGRRVAVYDQPPVQVDQPCPYTLSISIEPSEDRFDTVRITLDQSILGLGWNQIDAVELVGESD